MPKEVGPPHFEGEEVNGGRNTRWSGVVLTDAAVRAIGIVSCLLLLIKVLRQVLK
jgi:hypothetical protein